MQEEVTNRNVAIMVSGAKLTGRVLAKALTKYLNTFEKNMSQEDVKVGGKVSVKELAKENAGMVNIEITPKNIKSFERYARKYGVRYALKKDKTKDPPVYLVFFKGRDQDAINQAFREFSVKELNKANKPTLKKKLEVFRDVASKLNKDHVKHKHREQVR